MNNTLVAIIVGLAAAAGGVLLMDSLRSGEGGSSADPADLSSIEARLAAIERRLPPENTGGAQLGGQGIPTALLDRLEAIERALVDRPVTTGAAESGAAPAGSLARIDERLASIEEKLGGEQEGREIRVRPPRKKRVSLAEAAASLELSGAQEDELLQIYGRFHDRMYKLAAGPNGDPEEVKREVAAAAKDPTKAMKLVGKYVPNVIGNFGGLMEAQTERDAAIDKLLGPEKAKRLRNEFDVKEDNILGLGGTARTEFRMEGR